MSKFDPRTAERIAASVLAHENPKKASDADLNEAKVTELFEALHREGIQISSLKESKLRSHCARLGLSEAQTNRAVEDWLSWAVTDDVSGES